MSDPAATGQSGSGDQSGSGGQTDPPAVEQKPARLTASAVGSVRDQNHNGQQDVGDLFVVTVTVTDVGEGAATALVVSAPGLTTAACPTELAPAGSVDCFLTRPLSAADLAAGKISGTVTISATGADGASVAASAGYETTVQAPKQPAQLRMSSTAKVQDTNKDGRLDAGDTAVVSHVVRNVGKGAASALTVSDSRSASVPCDVSKLGPAGTPDSSTTCTSRYRLTLADLDRGVFAGKATASAEGEDGARTTAASAYSIALRAVPGLRASQSVSRVDVDGDGRIGAGDRLTYTVRVTNTGAVTLRAVRLADAALSKRHVGFSCAATSLAPGQSTTCTSGPYSPSVYQARQHGFVNWATASAVTPGGVKVTSNVTRTSTPLAPPAPHSAPGGSGHPGSGQHHPVTHHPAKHHPAKHHRPVKHHPTAVNHRVRVPRPPSITKLAMVQWLSAVTDHDKNGRLDAGDSVVYSFRVRNVGNTTITGLYVKDGKLSRNHVAVSCPTSVLAAGQTLTCTAQPLVLNRYMGKKGLGTNWAYAIGVAPAGWSVVASSRLSHGSVARADRDPGPLAMTGVNVGSALLAGGGLLGIGLLLQVLARPRRREAR